MRPWSISIAFEDACCFDETETPECYAFSANTIASTESVLLPWLKTLGARLIADGTAARLLGVEIEPYWPTVLKASGRQTKIGKRELKNPAYFSATMRDERTSTNFHLLVDAQSLHEARAIVEAFAWQQTDHFSVSCSPNSTPFAHVGDIVDWDGKPDDCS